MIPPLDPFALKFDSIEIDPARAPSKAAIENAMSFCAPAEDMLTASAAAPEFETPGFYLLDDAGGRFVVDRDMGVVSLKDDTLLERERGGVHPVRLRVVEQSGASYELSMQLRITGRVPQMVGAEDLAALAGVSGEPMLVAARVPTLVLPEAPTRAETTAPQPIAWTRFSAAQAHLQRTPRVQPRRGFITTDLPASGADVSLALAGLPAAFDAHLPWSL